MRVILYHPDGESLQLSDGEWNQLLENAKAGGWKPAGTLPPPIDLEHARDRWSGSYNPVIGQTVTRNDAKALADSLTNFGPVIDQTILRAAQFAAASGFIVCADVNSIGSSTLALCRAISGSQREPQREQRAERPVSSGWAS